MNTYRRTAITVGILFILATVLNVLGTSLSKPMLDAPDYLARVAANADRVLIGALLELIAAFACAGIAIWLYPVLEKHHKALALGAVAFRVTEGIFYTLAVLGLLSLLTLGQKYATAGASDVASFQTSGILVLALRKWAGELGVIAFTVGAMMYCVIFYRSKLMPRWIAGWGLLAIVATLFGAVLTISGQIAPLSTAFILLNVPIAVQEMVMAVWLIAKGFNPSGIVPPHGQTDGARF